MVASFIVYVDESGDEGFQFNKGSSEWFVLSAVIARSVQENNVASLLDTVRSALGKDPRKPLHFRNLKHEQRLLYVQKIAQANLRTISVLVHKPSIKEPEIFQGRYRLYFYTTRLLLERVSWLCRDNKKSSDTGDGSAELIFSHRSSLSYKELMDYMDTLETMSKYQDIRIDWSVIKTTQIKALPHHLRRGLQIADAVASSFYYAIQPSSLGFTEDRYTRMLKPVVYRRKGRYLGLGIKFWPRGVENLLMCSGEKSWVETEYT